MAYIKDLLLTLLLNRVIVAEENTHKKQLLVLAPPIKLNEYYKEKFLEVIPFYVDYVNNVTGKDDVVLIADKETMPYYKGKVDESKLILADIDDPWIRDVSSPIPSKNVQFTYIGGSTKVEAQHTQSIYDKFINDLGITTYKTDLYLDGGNLVNNNEDKVITTRKFLTDNDLSEEEGIEELKKVLNVTYVSILTQDEEKLGHSDGMAAYVCNNTIFMHKQPEPNNTRVKAELLKGCPHCEIVEIEGFFDNREYKEGYSSSCGVYVNCVVTENYIYMPIFKHQRDEEALRKFRNNTCGKEVVPIDVRTVCEMGGSLRCLSWQTSGDSARRVLEAAKRNNGSEIQNSTLSVSMILLTTLLAFLLSK